MVLVEELTPLLSFPAPAVFYTCDALVVEGDCAFGTAGFCTNTLVEKNQCNKRGNRELQPPSGKNARSDGEPPQCHANEKDE